MTDIDRLKKLLAANGQSFTKPRKDIFLAVQSSAAPVSVVQIAKSLPHVDKVSVYRAVALFEKIGVFHRVTQGFKRSVELSDAFSPHHHHFSCQNCGCVVSIESPQLESSLKSIENAHDFKVLGHSVELSGLCSNCHRI